MVLLEFSFRVFVEFSIKIPEVLFEIFIKIFFVGIWNFLISITADFSHHAYFSKKNLVKHFVIENAIDAQMAEHILKIQYSFGFLIKFSLFK
jgi:hypothetical protein